MYQAWGDRLSDLLVVFLFSEAQLDMLVEVRPEVRTGSKPPAEAQGRFGRD